MLNTSRFKKIGKRPYRQRIATMFLTTFICLLMLVILTGLLLYSIVMGTLLDKEFEKNQSMLRQAVLTMDNSMSNIDSYMTHIMLSAELESICSLSDPYTDPATVIESMRFKEYLATLNSIDSLVSDFIIYLKESNMLFTGNRQNFYDPSIFFRSFMSVTGKTTDETMQLFTGRYRNVSMIPVTLDIDRFESNTTKESVRCILYIRPIILGGSYMGNMIAVMPSDNFAHVLIDNAFNHASERVWIEDRSGNILMSLPDAYTETPSQDGMVACSADSSRFALTYKLLTPVDNAYDRIMPTLVSVVIIVAAIFIGGVLVSIWLAAHFGKPLDNISANLHALLLPGHKDASVGIKELRFLDNTVQALLEEQRTTAAYLSTQTSIVKRLFYEKLLDGYFLNNDQILDMLNQIGEMVYSAPIVLFVCRIYSGDKEISLSGSGFVKGALDEIAAEFLPGRFTSLDISLDTCVLLTSDSECAGRSQEVAAQIALKLSEALNKNPALACSLAVSPPIRQYLDIGSNYSRCLDAMQPPAYGQACSCFAVSDTPLRNVCAISMDDESRLANFLMSGSQKNAQDMLGSIFAERFGETRKINSADRLFITQFYFLLMRLQSRVSDDVFKPLIDKVSELPHRIASLHTPEDAYDLLDTLFCEWCELIQRNQIPKTQKLMSDIKAYIDSHYADPALSLQELAQHFALSDAYLSRAFKECMDVNIMSYVEQVRINCALPLIKEGHTFDAIAHEVGFDNTYRFRNAFKRVTGVLPSQYRSHM